MGHQNVDLKQVDFQLFLQQKKKKKIFIHDQQKISIWGLQL